MLPPHVQEYVPDDLQDSDLPLWYAAFETGRASVEPLHVKERRITPPVEEMPVTTEVNYGDPEPFVEQKGPDEDSVFSELLDFVKNNHPVIDVALFAEVARKEKEINSWIKNKSLPSGRLISMMVESVVEKIPTLIKKRK
jgi:hypothetical protein